MLRFRSFLFLTSIYLAILVSCGGDEKPDFIFTDNFDREAMLTHWADNIIIPSYEAYDNKLKELVESKNDFLSNPSLITLENLRNNYINAYKSWQWVSMHDIGKAEEISLRNYTNIYPTDTSLINQNCISQTYNLELPSNFDAQGFPALDYLLYGSEQDASSIITNLSSLGYSSYLSELIDRLYSLNTIVLDAWITTYRDTYINNSGSSGTASVDKTVNDYLFYYERFLRAGKVGIPAGVFSGNSISTAVEAPYSSIYSKALFLEGLAATEAFFRGQSYNNTDKGESLESYLLHVETQNQTSNITNDILNQWITARQRTEDINDSFKRQIIEDNSKMLQTYDALQEAVITLKVDMMQALNIQIDYVDADGD